MRTRPMMRHTRPQQGFSLLEVLAGISILAFGMLALGAMLSFAVQLPKLSGYRTTATNLATSYIERMRANPLGFSAGTYDNLRSDDNSQIKLVKDQTKACVYPLCDDGITLVALAAMDFEEMKVAARAELPAGGIVMSRTSATEGNLWIIWQEPSTYAALNPTSSDQCPDSVKNFDPKPRCLYLRFNV